MSDLTEKLSTLSSEVRMLEGSKRSETHKQLIALVDLDHELSRKIDKSEV